MTRLVWYNVSYVCSEDLILPTNKSLAAVLKNCCLLSELGSDLDLTLHAKLGVHVGMVGLRVVVLRIGRKCVP